MLYLYKTISTRFYERLLTIVFFMTASLFVSSVPAVFLRGRKALISPCQKPSLFTRPILRPGSAASSCQFAERSSHIQWKRTVPKMSMLTPTSPVEALLVTGLISVCFQAIFFFISLFLRTEKLVDVAGPVNFVVLAIATLILGPGPTARKSLVTIYVVIWGARLGLFLLMRILHWGHDRRLEPMRGSIGRTALFWGMQAFWVWVTSFPITLANTSPAGSALSWRDGVAGLVVAAAIILEAVADSTKLSHRQSDGESGKPWVNYGPWKWSRHPNYFAEIATWWGILAASWPDLGVETRWLAFLSPIMVTSLLLFVSGVPILEKNADRKYGYRNDYLEYQRSTSVLVPVPPLIYKRIPQFLKKSVLLEFDMYRQKPDQKPLTSTNDEL